MGQQPAARLARGIVVGGLALALGLAACDGTPSPNPAASPTGAPATGAPTTDPTAAGTEAGPGGAAPTPDATSTPRDPDWLFGPLDGGAGTWTALPDAPVSGDRTDWITGGSAWTGEELLVWGRTESFTGADGSTGILEVLTFDPAADRWRTSSSLREPDRRWWPDTVWTGDELLVLGGSDFGPQDEERDAEADWLAGVRWHAEMDGWRTIAPVPLERRFGYSLTWTGDELVLFGGGVEMDDPEAEFGWSIELKNDGAAWNPATDTWRRIDPAPIAGRLQHGAVWNGRRLILFAGGWSAADERYPEVVGGARMEHDDAAVWDPATGDWSTIASPPHATGAMVGAVMVGNQVVWWNGGTAGDFNGPGPHLGVWNPVTGEGRALPSPPMALRRDHAPFVALGDRGVATWGGSCGEGCNTNLGDGGVLDLEAGTWLHLANGDLGARGTHALAWTGEALLVWGGHVFDQVSQDERDAVDGARWTPER